ncbi:MAG: lipoprotein [Legionella longbeachae]|nr:lipoprotein [Legionella longbeachae]
MKQIYLAVMILIVSLFLSACGQKGPLYLPEFTLGSGSK